ncbi:MAG: hypothetical protein IPP72_14060 [Chitinophagaceae bacterium]|nr:hypothetical protein [Chitinophagaceae bacterium]
MQNQHYANHSRYVPLYHYVATTLLLAILIGSFINLYHAVNKAEAVYSASLICAMALLLGLVWFFARSFALKAQDRAIRAEENFRHFILTGKPFDNRLRMSQIIALRFAGDDELAALAQKAVAENLSSKQIKQSIQNWRGDYSRV